METALKTMDELAQGAIRDVDDPDAHYKLRTIRQLIRAIEQRDRDVSELLNEHVDEIGDRDVVENLRELGYVD